MKMNAIIKIQILIMRRTKSIRYISEYFNISRAYIYAYLRSIGIKRVILSEEEKKKRKQKCVRRYYRKNRKEIKKRSKEWYRENREVVLQKSQDERDKSISKEERKKKKLEKIYSRWDRLV